MPILLEELTKRLPSDTAERVAKAKERINRPIRDALREETGLTLNRISPDHHAPRTNFAVPIAIEPGLPEMLVPRDEQEIADEHWLSVVLAPYRYSLVGLRDSSREIMDKLIVELLSDGRGRDLLVGREKHLPPVHELAEFLLKKLNAFGLTKWILRFNEDVLGVYRSWATSLAAEPECKIEMYWGVMGLVARDLCVEVEDLTCVVLAHELAHAYTHVGLDIDPQRWPLAHFHESDLKLKEGLAQYYTGVVCTKVASQAPRAFAAYEKLLHEQPAAYQVHKKWEEDGYTPEHVRSALLEVRRSGGPGKLEHFEASLKNEMRRLRRQRHGTAAGA
jgi:hypothetical protein